MFFSTSPTPTTTTTTTSTTCLGQRQGQGQGSGPRPGGEGLRPGAALHLILAPKGRVPEGGIYTRGFYEFILRPLPLITRHLSPISR